MSSLFDRLNEDVRFREGLTACINCGTCTAICPAAGFYNYDPRIICDELQTRDEAALLRLLKSETIWYCGECMSCKTRCPKGNTPGFVIMALRSLSQDKGYFVESEKGRQQLAIKRTIGHWILEYGYCVYPREVTIESHPEQGPVWEWELQHLPDVLERVGANYEGDGPGTLRKIPVEALDELKAIFEVTGGMERFAKIEEASAKAARQLGLELNDDPGCEYFHSVYTSNNGEHAKE